ncbi:MAG: hypothetical protein LAP39_21945 [Acidobacteriia bacterium]|nr:hypothetical protein [Terriglobia bacterium]
MPRLKNFVQRSALILTGISMGAAVWKAISTGNASDDAGPLKESLEDLGARVATLESLENRHAAAEENSSSSSAQMLTAIASLESTVAVLTTRYDNRLAEAENRLTDHDAKLREVPTLAQVVSTMEEMLSSTMSGLDSKLFEQVRSIEVLQTTVAQSDELMGKVLDSIDLLRSHGESAAA